MALKRHPSPDDHIDTWRPSAQQLRQSFPAAHPSESWDSVSEAVLAAARQIDHDPGAALPTEIIYRMLTEDGYQPGPRPARFCETKWKYKMYLFKEEREPRRSCSTGADTYKHSGGLAVAKDLPAHRPVIRQRYGSVISNGSASSAPHSKYRRYNLLIPGTVHEKAASRLGEAMDVTLYHVIPNTKGTPVDELLLSSCDSARSMLSPCDSSESFDDGYEAGFAAGVSATSTLSMKDFRYHDTRRSKPDHS